MGYQVVVSKTAKRDLQRLDKGSQQRVSKRLQMLLDSPRPRGAVKLRGYENEWRIRVGDYRIIYQIDDNKNLVIILRIKHRREAYR